MAYDIRIISQQQMSSTGKLMATSRAVLAALVIFCFLGSYYYAFRVLPSSTTQSAIGPNLYPVWYASRVVLLDHQDPYSPAVTERIQQVMYGDRVNRVDGRFNEQRFAYPLFTVLLFAPFAILRFPDAQALVLVLSAAATAASTLVWLPRCVPLPAKLASMILVLAAPTVAWALQLRQLTLLFVALLALTVAAVRKDQLTLAGALGAVTLAKPQLAIAVLIPLIVWAFSDWWRRKRFVISFALAGCALLASSEGLCPGWLPHWVATIRAYTGYAGAQSLIRLLPGRNLPVLGAGLLLLAVLVVSWKWRNSDPQLAIGFSVAAFSVLLPFQVYNQIMLAPAVFWIVLRSGERGGKLLSRLRACMLMLLCAEWGTAALLAVAHAISRRAIGSLWALPFIPAWVLLLVVLACMIAIACARPKQSDSRLERPRQDLNPQLHSLALGQARRV